jgi:hypothetical protein
LACGEVKGWRPIRARAAPKRVKKFLESALDDNDEMLHNLASLLLTNTTLRSAA